MTVSSASPSPSSPRLPPDSSPRVPVREVLPLAGLVTDAGTQVRSAIDDDLVAEYAEALGDGARFPPIVVFRHDGADLVSDGFHRVAACRQAGRTEIEADVHHGTREDALWFALGGNRAHGKRLTRADKRHAIELAYRCWPDVSQGRIARQVGCTQAYVGRIREQVNTSIDLPDRVVGLDGRRYAATHPPSSRVESSSSTDADLASPPPPPRGAASRPPSESPLPTVGHESGGGPGPAAAGSPPRTGTQLRAPATPGKPPAALSPDAAGPQGSSPPVDSSDSPPDDSGSGPAAAGPAASQPARSRSNRIVSLVAYDAGNLLAQEDLIEFSALDRAELPGWIAALEAARRDLGRLIRRLREEVGDGAPSA